MTKPRLTLVDGVDAYGVNDAVLPTDYISQIASRGGATTLERHGREHYRRMGRLSAAKRKAKKEANANR